MPSRPAWIRRHAILKVPYRRAVDRTADFHTLSPAGQWSVLREQVAADGSPQGQALLRILDDREPRRDDVLVALEDGRQAHGS